jgi:hypothetical protein
MKIVFKIVFKTRILKNIKDCIYHSKCGVNYNDRVNFFNDGVYLKQEYLRT